MAELKPCPFCGGSDQGLMDRFPRFHDERTTHYVICYGCGCKTLLCETIKEAAKAWNRRAGNGNG